MTEQAQHETSAYGCPACETAYDTAAEAARCCPGCEGQRGGPPAQDRRPIASALDAAARALDYEECVSMQARRESAARAVAAFLRERARTESRKRVGIDLPVEWMHEMARAVEEVANAE